jgi:transposase
MCILAIDLGKSNSVACVYMMTDGAHRFRTVRTTLSEMEKLLDKERPERVVIEVCLQAGWVGDLVRTRGIALQIANTNDQAWSWRKVKRKTDRDDALRLAKMSAMDQLPTVHFPEHRTRQWRSVLRYRQTLVARRTSVKNRIRSILESEAIRLPSGSSGWTRVQRLRLAEMARSWDEADPDSFWRAMLGEELAHLEQLEASLKRVESRLDALASSDNRVERLKTIPGVGPRLAEMVVAVIDDPKRFRNGKQVGSYVGLTPRRFQSGQIDRQGRISGRGHKDLRKLLVEVSWVGIRFNPRMRTVFDRTCHGMKKRRKIAIVAVARRLLIWCWALLRDGTSWETAPPGARSRSIAQVA